jgi:hypothetical protein
MHDEEDQRQGEKYVDKKTRHVKRDEGEHPYDYEEEREEEKQKAHSLPPE